jgi:4-azaleucine resistance transporter AzlC
VTDGVVFTRKGFWLGVRRTLPIAVGVVLISALFGVLARQAHLSPIEAGLMSASVFAGASQFIALELWVQPLPVFTIIFTTFIVNLRHLLMGAALRPWLERLRASQLYSSLFFMTDETWALSIREFRRGLRDAGFMLGSGLTLFVPWVGGTLLGAILGAALSERDIAAWGLDFMFTAVFVTLLMAMWKGRSDLAPWMVAALVALGTKWLSPDTSWYILAGGLAGSLAGAFFSGDKPKAVGSESESEESEGHLIAFTSESQMADLRPPITDHHYER